MIVTVYLNEQKDAAGRLVGFFGYEPGHQLRQAFQYDTGDNGNPLEGAFFAFNVGHEPEYAAHKLHQAALNYRAARNRSLSVGDVVVYEGCAYAVAGTGWHEVGPESQLRNVTGRGPVNPDLEAYLDWLNEVPQ